MIAKLFRTSEGSIPFMQIILGAIIGAIAMLVYAKFCKPKILYDETVTIPIGPSVADPRLPQNQVKVSGKNVPAPVVAQTESAPVLFDIASIAPIQNDIQMPQLPSLHEIEDEDTEESEEEDDEDEDEDIPVARGTPLRGLDE